jgi:hypothetical protein
MAKTDSRSGSELLRDVEEKLDLLQRHVQNLDNNVKIMLARFNELMSAPPQEPVQLAGNQVDLTAKNPVNLHANEVKLGEGTEPKMYRYEDLPKAHKFEQMAAAQGIEVEPVHAEKRVKIVAKPADTSDRDPNELEEVGVRKGKQRGQRAPQQEGGRVNVSQKILSSNGNPVFLATVEILQDGNLVKQTRTKTTGRWSAPLEPGEYLVHVVKRAAPDSGKEPIDIQYAVEIPPSNEELELPSPDVE